MGGGASPSTRGPRLASIDIMRGLVMMLMTIGHVRETFFLHWQVSDPMDVAQVDTGLFFSRLTAHFCAPMLAFLTGLTEQPGWASCRGAVLHHLLRPMHAQRAG